MAAHMECRMYETKFPEVDDVVMVQVKSIAEMGAYVSLLEYNNVEGMILLSELSRRRIRSITKLIKVGRQEPVMVLRVDKEKGYIDLSKRRVSPEDLALCEDKFNKSKMIHSIMRHVAETTGNDVEDLYKNIGWPLYKMYGHAFEAFKAMVTDSETVFQKLSEQFHDGKEVPFLSEAVRAELIKNVQRRMTPQPLKIRADVELTCYAYDGVLHIQVHSFMQTTSNWKALLFSALAQVLESVLQEAMRAAEKAGTEECPVKMKLLAPPLYVLTTNTLEKNKGIEVLNAACQIAKTTVEARKGRLLVKEAARAVSERDDRLLNETMLSLEAANKEVAGDSDSEAEEDEGMGDIDVEAPAALSVEP